MQDKHQYKKSIKKKNYTVINCESCGYWHLWPIPTEEELDAYYQSQYYESLGDNRTMTDKLADPDGFYEITYADRLRRLLKFKPSNLPKAILDIGAGYGDFLRFMRKNDWKIQGLEPSSLACESTEYKKMLNIKQGGIDKILEVGFKKVAVVTLNNVLEHLRDPGKLLEVIREHLLLPGGIVLVIVPNDFSTLQYLLMNSVLKNDPQKRYYWIHPPEHVNYWNSKTIKEFLVKCGFEIVHHTADFPMEFFPLMGDDYITYPGLGKKAHLKRVQFEKCFLEADSASLKDKLFESFAKTGIGRDSHIIVTARI